MSGNYVNPASGVTFAVVVGNETIIPPFVGNGILVGLTKVTISNSWDSAGGGTVASGSVFTASNTTETGLAALGTYYVAPTATADISSVASLPTIWHIGGTLTYSTLLSVLGTTFDVDGGTLNAGTSGIAALNGETINLGDGGTADLGTTAISVLSGLALNFENGGAAEGGTFIVNGSTIPVGGLALLSGGSITNFVNANDKIEFAGLTTPVTSYTVSSVSGLGQQTITLYGGATDDSDPLATFTVGTLADPSALHVGTTSIITGSANPDTGSLSFSVGAEGLTVGADLSGTSILCFLGGTMIRTLDGEQAIETFNIGDLVLTAGGKVEEIRWIGISTNSAKGRDPLNVLPIRVRAGALGDNLPLRDLLVSPDHALLIDGVLVQAGALVNGLSVTREYDVPESFTYYHIELSSHELILAEGVPAETFVDNVSRMAFDNWAEHEALYGDAPIEEMALPRAQSARQMKPLTQHRLMARAEALFGVPLPIAA